MAAAAADFPDFPKPSTAADLYTEPSGFQPGDGHSRGHLRDGSFAVLPTTRQIRNERLYTPENIGGNFYTSLPIFTDIAEGGKYTG